MTRYFGLASDLGQVHGDDEILGGRLGMTYLPC
jgi:hypothetical protein